MNHGQLRKPSSGPGTNVSWMQRIGSGGHSGLGSLVWNRRTHRVECRAIIVGDGH
jgi:hypothetical protein